MPSERYLEEIKKKIKEAGELQLKELDLRGDRFDKEKKLNKIPGEVFELEHLEVLNLIGNQLTTVPESISNLQKLIALNLSNNQLTTLPDSISKLQNLTLLYLYNNQLTTVPESFSRLQNLTILDLTGNQLSTVPETISKLQKLPALILSTNQLTTVPQSISKLQKLTYLNLSFNKFTTVPESISKLQNLKSLDLSNNQLTTVPESITKLQNLKSLDLSKNQFTTVPESISKLKYLTSLNLQNNFLKTVPESISKRQNLTELDLSWNKLTTVPESISTLQNLKILKLQGNPIETPPPEVVFDKNGYTNLEGIKNYFRQLEIAERDYLEKYIPCNCSLCKNSKEPHFYRLENLKKRLLHKQFQVQCDESFENVEVLSLVDDFIEKDRDIGEIEDSIHTYADSRTKRDIQPVKEIYISYAWGGESEEIANRLDEAFKEKGITIIRDKRDLEFKGRIKEFMERIGRGKCVIVVISNKYLESRNCMFELMQIAKSGDFYGRMFPVVLDDAKIYDPVDRINYVQHWEKKKKALDDKMKSVSSEYLDGFREDIDLYADIRKYLPRLTDILRDMNTLTVKIHSETGFEDLVKAAAAKMEE